MFEHLYGAVMDEVLKLTKRLVIGEPFADPAPFMGPVIDNETADLLSESFLHLITNGGKALEYMRKPDEKLPFLTPGIVDTTPASACRHR